MTVHRDGKVHRLHFERGENIGGLRILVCAGRGTYHLTADAEFSAEIAKYYKNHIPCDDLLSVDDVIYKLAVCDMNGTQQHRH